MLCILRNIELEAFDSFVQIRTSGCNITGAGDKAFCAGNDLKFQASGGDMKVQPSTGFSELPHDWQSKACYAAVNGVAMGGV